MERIKFVTGDILKSRCEFIVIPVNCVGVMGAGLALQFRNSYPTNFREYANMCKRGELKMGVIKTTKTADFTAILFPTKEHWKLQSNVNDIKSGMTALKDFYNNMPPSFETRTAIPQLGCGLGGLRWADVKEIIISNLEEIIRINSLVFEIFETNNG